MIKVMTIFGTRPEAIKMSPVVKELANAKNIESIVVVTGQHREMLDDVLDAFDIRPDFDLGIMKNNQTLADITIEALNGLDKIIREIKPDIALVHGDTTTTFAGSLAAFYNQVKVGHIEAGLRTWHKYSPYPEEMNRQMTSLITDFHFAPTDRAKLNLLTEGKNEDSIFVTGNTAIDALKTTIRENYHHEILDLLGNSKMILLTSHRRENIGKPMSNIFKAIRMIADEFKDVSIVYPVHLNPKVRHIAEKILGNHKRIHLIDPLNVIDFHNMAFRSHIILTDSGGIQEEAPSLGKPVLVLRDTTERPEGIEAGTLKLAGIKTGTVYAMTKELLVNQNEYKKMSEAINPYGDGNASKRIVKTLTERVGNLVLL